MHHLTYKEEDQAGLDTLNVISNAGAFNNWMYQTIKPFCKGKIFEAGSGIGNISQYFLQDNMEITISDESTDYCNFLSKKFKNFPNLTAVLKMDLMDPDFDAKHGQLFEKFDTVFALNVVEHIKDDLLAVRNSVKLLKKGGNLVILVPASMLLYNKFDKELGHFKRYTKHKVKQLFLSGGLSVIDQQYFNALGMPGWFFSGMFSGSKSIPDGQMKLFEKLVPLAKLADKLVLNSVGLSVITVGRKS